MSTVRRVVPWKRNLQVDHEDHQILLDEFATHNPTASADLIERAYEKSRHAHSGQVRKSGEPYFVHPLAVARIVAEQRMDDQSIAAALLHDAVEDTEVSLAQITDDFGAEVAAIIDGCTKVDRLQFNSKEEQQAATLRKMMVAVAKDVRVLIIKLADRLHNMRTIGVLPVWKQQRTAKETMQVYAPLAHRLGMQSLRTQLEDLSFAAMHPKWYGEIDHMVAARDPERELYLTLVSGMVDQAMGQAAIQAQVTSRPKHLYGIYEKMVLKHREFDDIYDLVALRLICNDVKDCYGALGAIHSMWHPIQGRFKDFIAMPKFNLYQSLHTTVKGPKGMPMEVQIRTEEMHNRAEFGVAAHWTYKENGDSSSELAWLQRISEYSDAEADPSVFMHNLQLDLERDEVLVFSPKNRIVTMPVGATPVDFGYSIHTEIGHRAIGARIDGVTAGLDTVLESGQTVEIIVASDEEQGPSQEWLDFVVTERAIQHIRRWHAREERQDNAAQGQELLLAELRKAGLPGSEVMQSSTLETVAKAMSYPDQSSMLGAVAEGNVSLKAVASRVERALKGSDSADDERVSRSLFVTRERAEEDDRKSSVGVHVEGLDDVWVRLSKCCRPVPPDSIMGFHTRGRGVSVHRSDCANAVSLRSQQMDKLIDVEWDAAGASFVASVEVRAFDRRGLLRDVAEVLSHQDVNILRSESRTRMGDHVTTMQFDFELGDLAQLDSVLRTVRRVDGVYSAYRMTAA